MHLLLKRNYANLDVTRLCNEPVAVKTEDGSGWEHLVFHDFISEEDFKLINSQERKVACNAWRKDFADKWQYLEKHEYVAGVVVAGKLYIAINKEGPLIKADPDLNTLKPRSKASVTTLLS